MKRLGRIAAAFMASVFFLTGIPAMTAFAADEIPAAEEVVTETPVVEPVPETPAPETTDPEISAPETTQPGAETTIDVQETEIIGNSNVDETADATEEVETAVTLGIKGKPTLLGAEPSSELTKDEEDESEDEETPFIDVPFDNSTSVADGTYRILDGNIEFDPPKDRKGNPNFTLEKVVVKDGKATATMKSVSTSMTHVYVGSRTDVPAAESKLTDEDGNLVTNVYPINSQTVEFPVRLNEQVSFQTRTTAMSEPKWTGNEYTITITGDPEIPFIDVPFDNSTSVADGTYRILDGNIEFDPPKDRKGNPNFTLEKVVVKDGKATATMKSVSTSMTHVYVGSRTDVPAAESKLTDEDGNLVTNVYPINSQTVEFPVRLNEQVSFQTRTTAMSEPKWTGNKYTITITGAPVEDTEADYTAVNEAKAKVPSDLSKYTDESVAELEKALAAVKEGKKASEQDIVDGWAAAIEQAIAGLVEKEGDGGQDSKELKDGTYKAKVSCDSRMFPVSEDCTVIVKNGAYTVIIKMKDASNVAQNTVYLGKAADAVNNSSKWIKNGTDANGVYTFLLENVPIGEYFDLASYSINTKQWYDRKLIIDKDSLTPVSDDSGSDSGNKPDPKPTPTPTNDGKAEQESAHTTDLSGATSAVDNSTSLADGVYTPDKFSFSGGSGRGSFTCTKVTVTDGKAYATLVFSSNNYQYVKASGNIYYCDHSTGLSTVTIPVALNQNNTIVAMTTAMSAAHEITYTMFVYIAGADAQKGGALSNNEELDKEAPVIPGLTFESEEKLEYAENFKIFNYSDGIRLLEIDMRLRDDKDDAKKDDGKSSTKIDETTKKNAVLHDDEETLVDTQEVPADEADNDTIATTADAQAELYKGNVIKYLLVPENVEIPAGLEKEVIVINLPVESVYSGSDEIREIFKELKIEDLITSQVEEDKDNKDIVAAGDYKDLDLKALIKSKCDLVILPEDSIEAEDVKDEKAQKEAKENFEQLAEDLANLDVPVLVDRADYEETDNAKAEWIKIFGILFNCEKEANALFETMTK